MKKLLLPFLLVIVLAGAQQPSHRAVVHMSVPGYPRLAWAAQIEGDVHVHLLVGKDGKVNGMSSEVEGPGPLKEDTFTNIFTWVFTEAQQEEHLDVVYEYRLVPRRSAEPTSWVVLQSPQRITIYADAPEPNN